eukprot:UN32083
MLESQRKMQQHICEENTKEISKYKTMLVVKDIEIDRLYEEMAKMMRSIKKMKKFDKGNNSKSPE